MPPDVGWQDALIERIKRTLGQARLVLAPSVDPLTGPPDQDRSPSIDPLAEECFRDVQAVQAVGVRGSRWGSCRPLQSLVLLGCGFAVEPTLTLRALACTAREEVVLWRPWYHPDPRPRETPWNLGWLLGQVGEGDVLARRLVLHLDWWYMLGAPIPTAHSCLCVVLLARMLRDHPELEDLRLCLPGHAPPVAGEPLQPLSVWLGEDANLHDVRQWPLPGVSRLTLVTAYPTRAEASSRPRSPVPIPGGGPSPDPLAGPRDAL